MTLIIPLKDHDEISNNLNEVRKSTLFLFQRKERPISKLISDLEDKMLQDYNPPLNDNKLLKVYYQKDVKCDVETYPNEARKKQLCNLLQKAKILINRGCNDIDFCQSVNKKIDKAILSIINWPQYIDGVPKKT
jgi:hypothetical protein